MYNEIVTFPCWRIIFFYTNMLKGVLSILFSLGFYIVLAQSQGETKEPEKFKALIKIAPGDPPGNIFLIRTRKDLQPQFLTDLKIIRRLDQFHYIIRSEKQLSSNHVSVQVPANSLWKASDNLINEFQKSANLDIILLLQNNQSYTYLNLKSFKNVRVSGNQIFLRVKSNELVELLKDDRILFADLQRKAKEETLINNLDLSVNQINRVHSVYPSINGAGIVVSLKEGLYNLNDIDLLGKHLPSPTQSTTTSEHATIMATLVSGRGNSYIKGLGAAPGASLTSSDYQNLSADALRILTSLKVSVQNHSYGTGIENYYGIEALEYDRQVYSADTLTHVFSSGNSGTSTPVTGVYAGLTGFSNLTGTFKQAKNVLVIGGTNNENVAEALSSAGPAYDGRIKPDLVAAAEEGTSGAAALTSGVVSLLQQAYKSQTGLMPPSALIRSILVNSAEDLGVAAPDFKYGFGKLNSFGAMEALLKNQFYSGAVRAGEEVNFPLQITEKGEIKITLTWNDPPAEINRPRALINDLDLWIEDPHGNRILPWVLSNYPHADSLLRPAVRKRDSINNIEQVTFHAPSAGNYRIHVSGTRTDSVKQRFYTSYQVKQAETFNWTYPLENEQLFAAESNYLRWDSSISGSNGTVSVSYDKGVSWAEISMVDLNTGFLKWDAPDAFSKVMMKMSTAGREFTSGSFSISKPLKLTVGYNCPEEILLNWPREVSSASYNLYTLKNNRLQILKSTSDTTIAVKRNEIEAEFFAVSPVHLSGFEGLRSLTINAATQGVACYFQSLLADIGQDRNIVLSLKLGSVLGIKAIRFEKQTGPGIYSTVGNAVLSSDLSYSFTDFYPKKGIQFYRAVIETLDGRLLISDIASVIFLDTYQFTLYPNPVAQNFTVLSGSNEEFVLNIYNSQGQKLFTERMNNFIQSFNIEDFGKGIYVCVISLEGRAVFRTKIIKL